MSTKEEREFQISLVELSADIQTYLSIALGVAGISIAYFIGLDQIYYSLPSKTDAVGLGTLFAMIAGMIISIIYVRFFLKKVEKVRKDISELRKKYVSQETKDK